MDKSYYTCNLQVKITEKQKAMVSILTDILNEKRSEIVRRLLLAEAKRAASVLEGEELDLWVDLINQIEQEEEYHQFIVGEAISQGMKDSYRERTGKELGFIQEKELETLTDKRRRWQKNWRAKKKLEKLKELEEEYGTSPLSGTNSN